MPAANVITPVATTVSAVLATAGFKRNATRTTGDTGGFKVQTTPWNQGVEVSWRESDEDTLNRLIKAGLTLFADLPADKETAAAHAAAYADALSARYTVRLTGSSVFVTALSEPRPTVPGTQIIKGIKDRLRDAGVDVSRSSTQGYNAGYGLAFMQEFDHVRIHVRPHNDEQTLDEALTPITASLDAGGYPWTREDFITGAVLKVGARRKQEPADALPEQPVAEQPDPVVVMPPEGVMAERMALVLGAGGLISGEGMFLMACCHNADQDGRVVAPMQLLADEAHTSARAARSLKRRLTERGLLDAGGRVNFDLLRTMQRDQDKKERP